VLFTPSLQDSMNLFPIPQPAYNLSFIFPIIEKLEMIKSNRIKFLKNPHIIQLNEVIIGISNFELFEEMKQQSSFSKYGVLPIIESILKQRSFYPLLPLKADEKEKKDYKSTILDYSKLESLSFDVIPDIFIYPNKNLAYAKDYHKNLFIHPGCVCPSNLNSNSKVKGTYTRMFIFPNSKYTGLDVISRVKVEKISIEEN